MENNKNLNKQKADAIELVLTVGQQLSAKEGKPTEAPRHLSEDKISAQVYCPTIRRCFPMNINLGNDMTEWLVVIPIPNADNNAKNRLGKTLEVINKGFNKNLQVLTFALIEDGHAILGRLAYSDQSLFQENSCESFTVVMYTQIIENIQRFWPFFLSALDGSEEGDLVTRLKIASEEAVRNARSKGNLQGGHPNDSQEVSNAEAFVKQNFRMLCNMENAIKNKVHVVVPYVPKETGFSHARFMGRYLGFYHATWNDLRDPRMVKEKYGPGDDDVRIVMTSFTEEEQVAVDKLEEKAKAANQKNDSEMAFRLGLWEGIAILVHKEDLSLLYEETDIDLYKGVADSLMPSYEYSRLTALAIYEYVNNDKPMNEVVERIRKEGVDEKNAVHIVQGALPTIQQMELPARKIPSGIIIFLSVIGIMMMFITGFHTNIFLGSVVLAVPFLILLLFYKFSEAKRKGTFQKRVCEDLEESGIKSQWRDTSKPILSEGEKTGVRSLTSPVSKTNFDYDLPCDALLVAKELGKQYEALIVEGKAAIEMQSSDIFSASRFKGRELGFMMALICDRMSSEVSNLTDDKSQIASKLFSVYNGDLILSPDSHFRFANVELVMNDEEKRALANLKDKIDSCPNQVSLVCDEAVLGSYEGIIVYLRHLPISTLCIEETVLSK